MPPLHTDDTNHPEESESSQPFPEPVVPQSTSSHLQTLRTYQGDVEATIHKKHESIVSIATAEQKARENPIERKEEKIFVEKKENILLTYGLLPLLGIILIVVGGGAVAGAYYYLHIKSQPLTVNSENLLLQYSSKKSVVVDTANLRQTIENAFSALKKTSDVPGSLVYTDFQISSSSGTVALPVTDFLRAIGPSAPDGLMRSLSPVYMSGAFAATNSELIPFFIFSSASFGDTYADMLAWESTLPDNLFPFFGGYTTVTANTDATSTPVQGPIWTDESFNNHDVRVLRSDTGGIVVIYGFIDKNILIITGTEQAFESIVNKYTNARLVK